MHFVRRARKVSKHFKDILQRNFTTRYSQIWGSAGLRDVKLCALKDKMDETHS